MGQGIIPEGSYHWIYVGEVEEYKYLGVNFNLRGRIFRSHAKKVLSKAAQMAGRIRGICRSSFNKMMTGRVGWQSVGKPSFLYGSEIFILQKGEIKQLEQIQNSVYRSFLGVDRSTAIAGLRGEVQGWTIQDHLAISMLTFYRRMEWVSSDQWIRAIWDHVHKGGKKLWSSWLRQIYKWAEIYQVDLNKPMQSYRGWKKYVKTRIHEKSISEWRDDLNNLSSLSIFKYRKNFTFAKYGGNSLEYQLLCQARLGVLPVRKLKYRRGLDNSDICQMCNLGSVEDTPHFILECPAYSRARQDWGITNFSNGKESRPPLQDTRIWNTAKCLGVCDNWDRKEYSPILNFLLVAWTYRKYSIDQESQVE